MRYKVAMASSLPEPRNPTPAELLGGEQAEFVKAAATTETAVISLAQGADVLILSATPGTAAVIASLDRCRAIFNTGIGYDNIDVRTATARGICVCNVPDYCLEEVSDHAMALLLACARKVCRLETEARARRWAFSEVSKVWPGMLRLRGKTLGLVGLGHIARTLVPKAKGFGLNIIAFDPYVSPDVTTALGVTLVDSERLLTESDFVSIHVPLGPATRKMFGEAQFRKMKRTAYLINTARGPIVDEKALAAALAGKLIAGAALDVMESEPPAADNPLLKFDNVILTPHSAAASDSAMPDLWEKTLQNAVRVLRGEVPLNVVNPEVRDKYEARFGEKR